MHCQTPVPCTADVTLGEIPTQKDLEALRTLDSEQDQPKKSASPATQSTAEVVTLGAGLPPVPKKLVSRIQAGEFIDMSELLPDRLSATSPPFAKGDSSEAKGQAKPSRRQVANVLEWLQCYSIYVAVVTEKKPDKIKDLLGYQALIIQAKMENEGDAWLGYDRRFRQIAASKPELIWAQLDPTLWNLAFSGATKVARCAHCFSLTHVSRECDWAPQDATRRLKQQSPRTHICMSWNYNPECPYSDCRYKHVCLACNGNHKVTHCPQKRSYPSRGGYSRYQPYPRDRPPRLAGNPQQSLGYQERNGGWFG